MLADGRRPAGPAGPGRHLDERQAALHPVACARCGAVVHAVKFSPRHTSVQWSAAAVLACAELGALAAEGRPSALVQGCASLRSSIDAAVASGRLEVPPP
jgi:hypothetical protein